MCFLEDSYRKMQKKIKFWNFWEGSLYEIKIQSKLPSAIVFAQEHVEWIQHTPKQANVCRFEPETCGT